MNPHACKAAMPWHQHGLAYCMLCGSLNFVDDEGSTEGLNSQMHNLCNTQSPLRAIPKTQHTIIHSRQQTRRLPSGFWRWVVLALSLAWQHMATTSSRCGAQQHRASQKHACLQCVSVCCPKAQQSCSCHDSACMHHHDNPSRELVPVLHGMPAVVCPDLTLALDGPHWLHRGPQAKPSVALADKLSPGRRFWVWAWPR